MSSQGPCAAAFLKAEVVSRLSRFCSRRMSRCARRLFRNEIRNPKLEIRNNFQITSMNDRNETCRLAPFGALAFCSSNLSRNSNFGFRALDSLRVIHFPIEQRRPHANHSGKHGLRNSTPHKHWNMSGKMSSQNARISREKCEKMSRIFPRDFFFAELCNRAWPD